MEMKKERSLTASKGEDGKVRRQRKGASGHTMRQTKEGVCVFLSGSFCP